LLLAAAAATMSLAPLTPAASARGSSAANFSPALAPLSPGVAEAIGWGDNFSGQLGNGTTNSTSLPVAASGLTEVTAIAAGNFHSLAVLSNGTVEAWGDNETGELGNGTRKESDVPVQVSGLSEVTAVAAGQGDSFALLKNGTVMAWGFNQGYRLGIGGAEGPEQCPPPGSCSTKPVLISGLHEVVAIAAGEDHALALLKNGTVMAWGRNQTGQLGDGSFELSSVPVAVSGVTEAVAIAAGADHSLALLKSGKVMAWGANGHGQLGTGTTTGPEPCGEGHGCSRTPVEVNGVNEAVAVAAGELHSLALLKGGTLKAWGYNHYGQLGDGTTEDRALPVGVTGLTEVAGIASGRDHSLARLASGMAEAWGANEVGALGDGNTTESPVPVAVKGVRQVTALAGGGYHSLAIGSLIPVPTITSVEPNQGQASGGTSVTITGTHLNEVTSVKFGSAAAASYTVNSETSITAVSPPGTGTVDITVAIEGTESPTGASDRFSYAPTVLAVEPPYGAAAGGTSVTINGKNFREVAAVKFGGASAKSFTVQSETKISAVSPPGTGVADVTVTSAGGTSPTSSADQFSYAPSVTALQPSYGPKAGGTPVTITGTNFTEVTAVRFGSTSATKYTVNGTSSITATSPAGTGGTVDVTVSSAGGTSPTNSADKFSYGPTIATVSPASGATEGGTLVKITGANLSGATEVKFGSTRAATFTVNSPTSLNAVSPAGNGTIDITVTTPEGTSTTSTADQFTYNTPQCGGRNPVVTAVEPSSGPAESSVTIRGEHFFEVICGDIGNNVRRVIFGAQEASFSNGGPENVVAPVGTGTVDVRIEMQNGATSAINSADRFTYTRPVPSVTKLKPDHGPSSGGTSVTITGTNLLGATAVSFGSTSATSFTVNSRQSITAVAPVGTGIVDVTVTTPEGTSAANAGGRFTYGQPPPIVETGPAYYVTQNSATLYATVNPDGAEVTECKLEYGTTNSYGSSATCSPSPGSGEGAVSVSAPIAGLSPNTTYHYRISATNLGGTSKGSDATFATAPSPPAVETGAATSITQATATLNGTVNPNGAEVSSCRFEYGTSESYGSSASCASMPGSGTSPVAVSAAVAGLSANTTYHFRISATNPGGAAKGSDATFTTAKAVIPKHWYRNGALATGGLRLPFVIFGGSTDLADTSGLGEVHCKTVGAGYAENPAGKGTGVGKLQALAFYSCVAPQCEAQVKEKFGVAGRSVIAAENIALPPNTSGEGWVLELFEGGSPTSARELIGVPWQSFPQGGQKAHESPPGMVRLTILCTAPALQTVVTEGVFEGALEPEVGEAAAGELNGSSAAHPSTWSFTGASSGALHSEVGGEATYSGNLKYLGYNAEEVIGVK
jgi:alpha-tubulin suppressor-like RCC1 family protein